MQDYRILQKHIYAKFYELLSEKFFSLYLSHRNAPPKKGSRDMWKSVTAPNTNGMLEYVSAKLFDTRSPEYFYRKNLIALNNKEVQINKSSLCRALEFIGIKVPHDNIEMTTNFIDKEDFLYNKFITSYNLKEYFINSKIHSSSIVSVNTSQYIDQIDDLIKKFYTILTLKENLESAWNLLTPNFQERAWGSKYEQFLYGYLNFRGVKNLAVFNINQVNNNEAECLIYYEDEIDMFLSPDLSGLEALTVKDIDKLVFRIKTMHENLTVLGINGFQNIELYKLFDPVASEYLIYKCKFQTNDHYSFFNSKRTTIVKRLYQCRCILINEKWLIHGIRMLPTYSSR